MRTILTTLIILLSMSTFSFTAEAKKEKGKVSKPVSEEIAILDYTELSLQGSANLVYEEKPDQEPYLRLEIDENLKNYILCEVKNGKLLIKSTKPITPKVFKVYTNSTSISKVKLVGAGNVSLSNKITGNDIEIEIVGSGGLQAQDLTCKNLKVKISKSGRALVTGSVTNAKYEVVKGGIINAYAMISKKANCSVIEAGDIHVLASDYLSAKATGSGNVLYKGSPKKIDLKNMGLGSISPR